MIIKSVQDIYNSNLAGLMKKYKNLGKKSLTVGIHKKDNKKYPNSNVTTAEVGLYQEFGTEKLPPRIWLRIFDVVTAEKKELGGFIAKAFREGKDINFVLNEIGGYMSERIKDRILSNEVTPPSDNNTGITLVDTGQLVNSIDYEVNDVQ